MTDAFLYCRGRPIGKLFACLTGSNDYPWIRMKGAAQRGEYLPAMESAD
jgi:hypothetical protein